MVFKEFQSLEADQESAANNCYSIVTLSMVRSVGPSIFVISLYDLCL